MARAARIEDTTFLLPDPLTGRVGPTSLAGFVMSVSTESRLAGPAQVAVRLSLRLLLLSIISNGGPVT